MLKAEFGDGTNHDASLALPHSNIVSSVEMWQEKAKIRFISAGNYRTLLIDEEGDVWYAGWRNNATQDQN